jgi:hypothetical protein
LTAKFASEGPVKICVDHGFDSSFRKRELSDSLDFVADSNATAAENTFTGIPLKKG